ncbi:MAG: ABC transporter permease, partial [Geminicoccaceae bacterium]
MKRLGVSFWLGALLVGTILLVAALAVVWTPHDPTAIHIANRHAPPSAAHWLGTDALGRDIASLLMVGAQTSMQVAFLSVGLGGLLGTALGLLASARGGWTEEAVMRLADVGFAFPALLFAIMLAAAFGPSFANAVLAIAFIVVPTVARVVRATANQIWARDYVRAAQAVGHSRLAITRKHVLPNVAPILTV